MSTRSKVLEQLAQVAHEQDKTFIALSDDLPLLNSGLDSLSLAIVVARLEELLGIDPFSADEESAFPVTVGDFIRFYEKALAAVSQKNRPVLKSELPDSSLTGY